MVVKYDIYTMLPRTPPCSYNDHYRAYHDFEEAADGWYANIANNYIADGEVTIKQVVWKYYPPGVDNNNPQEYYGEITDWMRRWRAEDKGGK